jgi:hypothetical protein
VRILGERVGAPAAEPLRNIVRSQHGRPRREALEALELMGQARDEDRLALATAELSDKAAPCPAILNAVRVLVVAGTERAQALLSKTASERRRCGSREAADALRRLERAKAQAGATGQPGTVAANATSNASLTPTAIPTPNATPTSTANATPSSTALAAAPKSAHKPTKATAKRRRKAKAKAKTAAKAPALPPPATAAR